MERSQLPNMQTSLTNREGVLAASVQLRSLVASDRERLEHAKFDRVEPAERPVCPWSRVRTDSHESSRRRSAVGRIECEEGRAERGKYPPKSELLLASGIGDQIESTISRRPTIEYTDPTTICGCQISSPFH